MADTGTDVTEHRPHSIMERSNSERTRVAAFLRRFPEYAELPHDILLQFADEKAVEIWDAEEWAYMNDTGLRAIRDQKPGDDR